MKNKIYFFLLFIGYASIGVSQQADDLFISEYCEYDQTIVSPTYYNHYIEIYNGTGDTVDMSNYQLWRSMNATGWLNNEGVIEEPLTLQGKLANNQCYVITRPNDPDKPINIIAYSDQTWSFLNISGDDAIGLAKKGTDGTFEVIDLIGSETTDPGAAWTVAGTSNATQNHTLIRKETVLSPTTDWETSAGTDTDNSQWIVRNVNDVSDIGRHSFIGDENPPTLTDTLSVLFIGNSYTYYNDLPTLVNSIANTNGKVLIHDQSTPGGYTLEEHYVNATTLSKIRSASYNFVVLQDQSQRPTKPIEVVEEQTFKYAHLLDSLRRLNSPCGQTVFYMTWGRENGDTQNCAEIPEVCTFEGMNNLLRERYMMMEDVNDALISPVGAVWRYVRENHPELGLYIEDESHPSPIGSFISATSFYTVFFQDNPLNTSFNYTLTDSVAQIIREAASAVVFDSLDYWNSYKPGCNGSMQVSLLKPTITDTLYKNEPFNIEVEVIAGDSEIDKVEFYLNYKLVEVVEEEPYNIEVSSARTGTNYIMIRVFDADSNINITRKEFNVNYPSGIDNTIDNHIKIYPNPCKSDINIELTDVGLPAEISVYNQLGQLVTEGKILEKNHKLDMNKLKSGFYMIEIKSTEFIYKTKLLKTEI